MRKGTSLESQGRTVGKEWAERKETSSDTEKKEQLEREKIKIVI